jgi:ATP-dependent DNA ligase
MSTPARRTSIDPMPQRHSPSMLNFIPPMLLQLVPKLPEGAQWQYEVKWDGYLAVRKARYRVSGSDTKRFDFTGPQ